jgi:tetratricopeptide (TPR) repeat protein
LAVAQPRSAAERDRALANLYAHLATAEDEKQARTVSASIEALWATPGSDTISYLMQRAHGAIHTKKMDLALQLYDRVVALAPDYAEGWNQRAIAHIHNKDYERAMGDVRRTLALDPNHFRALDGLFHILSETGRKKEALKVGRQLLEVNPFYEGARQAVDELAREIEGRGI